ncbi:NUDIX hydrolase [Gloeocapsopsis dulcis]|uniref:ADP-ribose pyrophosphatase n=1 Tax=Gloeocapsopsis dulcis AAB1 = 1H9 TaxID=1433147 RepID=A0A6N8FRB5_9CHRO|nr:NUDIX hydrolase [Gloeocapsopsis dulcis]MUL35663.1 ADP-ribose pyrophosphatase [Gloeocapsopsis dulcis AAB1 = 1H9]WNN87437.1 NUDIX hydrolase [Gloeocapsopsis dulcis]
MSLKWLKWSQQLQAIAQIGLTYSQSPYDSERYQQIRQIAAEIMATYAHEAPTYVCDLFSKEEGYATPKVDVRGAVFHNNQILLVKEREDGCWTLPGGWVDVGESPSQAVVREVYEESGYHTQIVKLLAIYDRNHPRHQHPPIRHHVYKLFFQCQLIGGSPAESTETTEAAFFTAHDIPELSLTRVVPSQISRLFEHYRNPEWQADFD